MLRILSIIPVAFLLLNLLQSVAICSTLKLSQEEREWLASHPVVRISGPQAFPPFQYVDDNGTMQGMASDYLIHLSKMVGFTVEMAPKQPWPKVLAGVKDREIDLLTCAAETEERLQYLNFTTPHLSFPLVIISRTNYPYIDGLKGLYQKKVALVAKNSTVDWLKRDGIGVHFHFVSSPLAALEAVSLGEADATIDNLAASIHLIEKHGLNNLKIASPTSYGNYSLSIGVRKDWPELTGILNKALADMSAQDHSAIRSRWISVKYEQDIVSLFSMIKWLIAGLAVVLCIISIFFYWNRKLQLEVNHRKETEEKNVQLIDELKEALSEIHTLRGILPICSHCKKIRDDKGTWNRIECYIEEHSDAEFSHSICQDCAKNYFPELSGIESTTKKKS